MKRDKLLVLFIETIFLATLTFLLLGNKLNYRTLALVFGVFGIITFALIKRNKNVSIYSKEVTLLLTIVAFTYLVLYYGMGLYFGFYRSAVQLSWWSLKRFILPLTLIIVFGEYLRHKYLSQNSKLSSVLITVFLIIANFAVYVRIYDIRTFDGFLTLIGLTLFGAIALNLLCNYISKRYGPIPNIIYRYITTMYMYFIPITPDIFTFFMAFLNILVPYLIYLLVDYGYTKKVNAVAYKDKRKAAIGFTAFLAAAVAVVLVISNAFTYRLIVVGSSSMTGTADKGDAVVYESYEAGDVIKVGDIIIYQKDNTEIIHRVVEIEKVNGVYRYITKGDANQNKDTDYVLSNQIIGKYNFSIPYIGYLTLWIRDIFNKK